MLFYSKHTKKAVIKFHNDSFKLKKYIKIGYYFFFLVDKLKGAYKGQKANNAVNAGISANKPHQLLKTIPKTAIATAIIQRII